MVVCKFALTPLGPMHTCNCNAGYMTGYHWACILVKVLFVLNAPVDIIIIVTCTSIQTLNIDECDFNTTLTAVLITAPIL